MSTDVSAVVIASKVGLPWDYGLSMFVSQSPSDLRLVDEETGFHPFMLSACSSLHANANLDSVYRSLIACPDVVEAQELSRGKRKATVACDDAKSDAKKRRTTGEECD